MEAYSISRDAIREYDEVFHHNSSTGKAKRLGKSLQWQLTQKDVLSKHKTEIGAHFNALSMLLITANVYVKTPRSKVLRSHLSSSW